MQIVRTSNYLLLTHHSLFILHNFSASLSLPLVDMDGQASLQKDFESKLEPLKSTSSATPILGATSLVVYC